MSNTPHMTLRISPERKAAYMAAAAKAGLSLTEWMFEQCDAALPKRTAAKLSERKGRGRPTTSKGET